MGSHLWVLLHEGRVLRRVLHAVLMLQHEDRLLLVLVSSQRHHLVLERAGHLVHLLEGHAVDLGDVLDEGLELQGVEVGHRDHGVIAEQSSCRIDKDIPVTCVCIDIRKAHSVSSQKSAPKQTVWYRIDLRDA